MSECYMNVSMVKEIKDKIQNTMKHKSLVEVHELEIPSCIGQDDIDGLITENIYHSSGFLFTEHTVDQGVNALNHLVATFSEETKDTKSKKKTGLTPEHVVAELRKNT